jgi:hypothetical protein
MGRQAGFLQGKSATVEPTGQLVVRFEDERILEVDPDDQYEAWQVTNESPRLMLFCTPGGKVAAWA